eukprot:728049-Pleurochrysis_carterae.AAC.1
MCVRVCVCVCVYVLAGGPYHAASRALLRDQLHAMLLRSATAPCDGFPNPNFVASAPSESRNGQTSMDNARAADDLALALVNAALSSSAEKQAAQPLLPRLVRTVRAAVDQVCVHAMRYARTYAATRACSKARAVTVSYTHLRAHETDSYL